MKEKFDHFELKKMIDKMREQYNNEINCTFVVPDWNSFNETVKDSKHSLIQRDRKFWMNDVDYSSEPSMVTQTRIDSHYEFMPESESAFGWKDIYCRWCGTDGLFYDSVEEAYYCPVCHRT